MQKISRTGGLLYLWVITVSKKIYTYCLMSKNT